MGILYIVGVLRVVTYKFLNSNPVTVGRGSDVKGAASWALEAPFARICSTQIPGFRA